jgi:hypothetical protein
MSDPVKLTQEQQAELAPILNAYLKEANETLRLTKEMLHEGRHARVARRTLRMIRDREQAFIYDGTRSNSETEQ